MNFKNLNAIIHLGFCSRELLFGHVEAQSGQRLSASWPSNWALHPMTQKIIKKGGINPGLSTLNLCSHSYFVCHRWILNVFCFTRDMLCPTVQACDGIQGIELNVNRLTFEKPTGSGWCTIKPARVTFHFSSANHCGGRERLVRNPHYTLEEDLRSDKLSHTPP